ncbi:MAG: hypothetical protein LBM13_06205 [Candidatus Ancillula sp.]|jgi:hypothetical protein|nr:hypothetical protein [Candidatus Ancillula sp.]
MSDQITYDKQFLKNNVINKVGDCKTKVDGIKSDMQKQELSGGDWGLVMKPIGGMYQVCQKGMVSLMEQLSQKLEEHKGKLEQYQKYVEQDEQNKIDLISQYKDAISQFE